jgi:hypothetical protein
MRRLKLLQKTWQINQNRRYVGRNGVHGMQKNGGSAPGGSVN